MKYKILKPQDIEITSVLIELPVDYGDEDIPNDFPGRKGDTWFGLVDIDTGMIKDWPKKYGSAQLEMKVVDTGTYTLYGPNDEEIIKIQDYVPNRLIPGDFGDYVNLHIDETGRIVNWPEPDRIDLSEFFPEERER